MSLKSEFGSESLMPLEEPEEANMAKSEEEIAKIQEKLLLIGASDEITDQELGENMQKFLNPTTVEFKISTTTNETILTTIEEEEINNNKDKIFDHKEENVTLGNNSLENATLNKNTITLAQNQKYTTHLKNDDKFITKEYLKQVRDSLDKALNAIKI